jgi:hypothetical protein
MIESVVMYTDGDEKAPEWATTTAKPTAEPPEPPSKQGNASAAPRPTEPKPDQPPVPLRESERQTP